MTITKNNFILIALLGIFIAFSLFGNEVSAQESDRLFISPDDPSDEKVIEIDAAVTDDAIIDKIQIASYDKNDKFITYSVERQRIYGRNKQLAGHQSGDIDSGTSLRWQQVQDTNGASDNVATDKMPQGNTVFGNVNFNDGSSTDWHLPTVKELFALMDFSSSIPSGYEGNNTSGLILFTDMAYFDFAYGKEGSGEDIFEDRYTSRITYLASIAFAYHSVRIGDDSIADTTADTMGSQIESGDDLNRENSLDREEEENVEEKSGDGGLHNATKHQSVLNFIRSNGASGSATIDAMFNTTPILNDAGYGNNPDSDFEYKLPFMDPNYFSSVSGEETTRQPYESNHFYGNVAIDDEMDSVYNVNIFTIDTQGSITGIARKIRGMLP